MSVKKALKTKPWEFGKKAEILKRDLKHKPPKPDTSAQEEALEQGRSAQAALDEEENRRRKRLFAAATGVRAFRGSAMFRSTPGNTAGSVAAPSRAPGRAVVSARRGTGGAIP